LIGDLIPPFSPARYIEAVNEFQRAGVEVLIIDSTSHEYEGEGGVCDIAENNKLGGLPNWAMAKGMHKRFINALLYCDMHVIACLRAREKARPETIIDPDTGKKKTVYISEGLAAITEKNALFEMTASLMVTDQGMSQTVIKCPADLMPYLGRGSGYLTEEDGRAIRRWVDGLGNIDPAVENARHLLEQSCEQGMEEVRRAWESTPPEVRRALGGRVFLDTIKASATEYDRQRAVDITPPTPANENQQKGGAQGE